MAKTYSELEAWAIFASALVVGIVLTSLFWAYITVPAEVKNIENEIDNASKSNLSQQIITEIPNDFVKFCYTIEGTPYWDSTGAKSCSMDDYSQKNLIVMGFLCKKFNLTLSYGSFGVKCERKI